MAESEHAVRPELSWQVLCHMHTALLVSRLIQKLGNRLYWIGTQASQHKHPNRQLFTINGKIFDTCFSSWES